MTLRRLLLPASAFLMVGTGSAMTESKPPAHNTMGNVTNNTGIVTQGQVGNNTIIQGDPLDVKILGQLESLHNDDGTYTARIMIDVQPATRLLAVACGDGVTGVSMGIWTGMMAGESIPQPQRGNCHAAFYSGVSGQWVVKVTLKSKESKFQLSFEKVK